MGKKAITIYTPKGCVESGSPYTELDSFELLPLKKRDYRVKHYEKVALPQDFSQYLFHSIGIEVPEEFEAVGHKIELHPARSLTPFLPTEGQAAMLLYQHTGEVTVRIGNAFDRARLHNQYRVAEGEVGLILGDGKRAFENATGINSQTVICDVAVSSLQFSSQPGLFTQH